MVQRLVILAAAIFALGSAPAIAQDVPAAALAAEGQQQWDEALRLYRQVLEREPGRADLWVRVSDIHARLGRTQESLTSLESAVQARPGDPELFARLSRGYAAADRPSAALLAIRGALALRPDLPAYLSACGELASWSGEYAEARACYQRLLLVSPDETEARLALARVHAWDGKSDAAAAAYRDYLHHVPADRTAWLEAARAESWRGNDRGAYGLLQAYRAQFGESDAYLRELAAVLTRGRRPARALGVLRPLLSGAPADYELNLVRALAYTEYGHGRKATQAFGTVSALGPERKETTNLERQLGIAFGSLLQPSGTGYGDSDGLRSYRVPLAVSVAVTPSLRLQTGYERHHLRARAGSGLERLDGGRDATLERAWAGAELRALPQILLRVQAGRQDSVAREEWTYAAGAALRLSDAVRVDYDREHSLMTISPRAVSLGIVRDVDRLRLGWVPTFSFGLDVDASREALSDGNARWAFRTAPRVALVRNQRLNLDVGAAAYLFAADRDLSNGYYDPSRYEFYGLTLLPYLKFSENHGLSLFVEAGVQKDEHQPGFEPGGSAAAELTLGIFRAWMLKLNASATVNSRLESGAFRGFSSAVVLTRRF